MSYLILAYAAALAAQPDCSEAVSQMEANICSARGAQRADADLNRQWARSAAQAKALDKDLDPIADPRPGYYETLLSGQRAWLKYRDAHCTSERFMGRGGTIEPLLANSCVERLTRARIKELADLQKGLGN